MSYVWKKPLGKAVAVLLALTMVLSPLSDAGVLTAHAADMSITEEKGYEEGAYAKWSAVSGADSYKAYVSSNGGAFTEINGAMIRVSGTTYRVDEVGLKAGTCQIKVEAYADGTLLASATTGNLTVRNYDRSGYAHYNYTEGVGAYKDDGTLKDNAIVLYVTDANKDTVSVTSKDGTTVTGIGNILNSVGQESANGLCSKGGTANTNQDIIRKLADDGTPLVVRIIGTVTAPEGVTAYNCEDYGGTKGDNGYMARMQSGKDITIEGIGSDAWIDGWGFHFICSSSHTEYGKSFEVRNISFKNVPEDCVGMEGQQEGSVITAPVERCWIHDCAFYAPSIANPAESDKAGGDGACDFKRGRYLTNSYCYYYGYHKTNLVGSSDSSLQYHLTYHHNFWESCESRGPLARQADIHMYNNIFQGQTSYCMNTRANAYIFSEYNTFINCKNPAVVDSGAIKSYQDSFTCCIEENAATIVTDKSTQVSSSNLYANFDTDASMSYIPSGNYWLQTDLTEVKKTITAYTGPLKDTPVEPEEVSTSVILSDRMPSEAVTLPYNKNLEKTYVTAKSAVVDNIVFNVSKLNADSLTVGGDTTGQNIVFKVNTAVNVSMTEISGTYSPILCNDSGLALLEGSGTVRNLPAGVYFIQSGGWDAKGKYKEAKIASLSIEAYDPNAPVETDYAITVQNDGNGTASANVTKATKGSTVTLTATPNSGYVFDSWQVVSGSVTITSDKFVMPESNVTVKALFKEKASSSIGTTDGTNDGNDGDDVGGNTTGTVYAHNFTTSGTSSTYYTIKGNLSTSKGSTTYKGMSLTQCLKIEGSTNISFTAGAAGTLTLVLDTSSTKSIKIDNIAYAASQGIVTVDLAAGTHTILKKDSCNLFYMEFATSGSSSGSSGDGSSTGGSGDGGSGSESGSGSTTVAVTGVTLNKSSLTLTGKGTTETLTATVAPSNASNKNVTWKSGNSAVATVSNGVVKAVGNGSTTITVTTADGSKTASCQVTVAISAAEGGEVDDKISLTESKGYQEGAYAEWKPVLGAAGYKAYVAKDGGSYTAIDDSLIRQYADYWRVDAVGLAAGTYTIKVEAVMAEGSLEATTGNLSVIAYDRSGFAWTNGTSSGAYNEDGTLKSTAKVLYVTENNKADMMTELAAVVKGGYPLCIRIIGNVTPASNFEKGDLLVDKCTTTGVTIEGIGEDATANGWGVRIKNSSNIEVRNLGFMNCASDEGDSVGLQQGNDHVWIHDNDFFYGAAGSDADQVKGDGALDTKKSTYVTHAYNHFYDTGKTHLNGNGDTTLNYITYHHNWYDHSDSRHPLVRCSSAVHVYNNLYDGVSKYGMIARKGSSIFSEANYFKDTKSPMLISQQGTDIASGDPISSEDGGMIKSFGNVYDNTTAPITHKDSATSFDCYEAETQKEVVPSTYVTLKGGTAYSNFDTASGFYSYDVQTAATAKTLVETYAGRVNGGDFSWDFSDPEEDTNFSVNKALQSALQNYTSSLVGVGGMNGETVNPGGGSGSGSGSGSGEGTTKATYTITVDLADGSAKTTFTVTEGDAITTTQLSVPERGGFSFTGWVDGNNQAVVLPYTPTASMTITATWQQNASGGETLDPTALYNKKLNVQMIPGGSYTESFTKSGFTVKAGSGADQSVTVEANNKKINGTSYTYRLKLGGAGTKDYRSIMFTADAAATLEFGCIAATSSATYHLGIATLDKEGNFVDLTGSVDINGTATDCADGSIPVSGSSASYYSVAIPAAGTYYIYGKDGGVNFYYLNLIYENGKEMPVYTVTFNTMGGLSVASQQVCQGEACVEPSGTLRSGYTFAGWYGDYGCTAAYDFSKPITGNITIYAKWTEGEKGYQHVLDMSELPARDYTENVTKNGFTLNATSSKNLTVELGSAVVGEETYTHKLKLNGTGKETERSISFTTDKATTLTIVAASGSAGTARALVVTNGSAKYTISNIDSAAKFTQELAAGTWYVYSSGSGVNIYYISALAEGETVPDPDEGDDPGKGTEDGSDKGTNDGSDKGTGDGSDKGTNDGSDKGTGDGSDKGTNDGSDKGTGDGSDKGTNDGGDKNPTIDKETGLKVQLADADEEYVYTGSAICPAIVVTNNGEELVAGVDYTVKYTNNVKASGMAKITVTGKNNLTGSNSTTFTIQPKNLADEEVKKGAIVVVKGSKAVPVLSYNNMKLGTKDYDNADKAVKFTEDGTVTLQGKGNFTGTCTIPVKVVEKGQLKKFVVALTDTNLTYDGSGEDLKPTVLVTDKTSKEALEEGEDYEVVYSTAHPVNAGTVKVTVIGHGWYSGSVTKTYKIKPLAVKENNAMEISGIDEDGYAFTGNAVTVGKNLTVNCLTTGEELVAGKDYKVTYSNNKKVGTGKFTISFIGNYKGSKAVKGTFGIKASPLSDNMDNLKIVVGDKVYTGKPGTYPSKPMVSVGSVLLKASEVKVSYYLSADFDPESKISGKNKVALEEGEDSKTVYVKIEGKGNWASEGEEYATASYQVCKKPVYDLSKAQVTFWDGDKKVTKVEYTGEEIQPVVKVMCKKNGKGAFVEVPAELYAVSYVNNINKGTASVVVTANGSETAEQEDCAGSKTATFKITAKNLKTLNDLLKDLFHL